MQGPSAARESLVMLTVGPVIWGAHFLLSYITAAIWCAKIAGRTGSLDGAAIAVAIYTAVALAGIATISVVSFRRHSFGTATAPHDFPTDADRHRFLGLATLLLSLLSGVATVYVALPIIFIGSCR